MRKFRTTYEYLGREWQDRCRAAVYGAISKLIINAGRTSEYL